VAVSALTGEGLGELLADLDKLLYQQMIPVDVLIPYARSELVALAHKHGFVENEEHTPQGTSLQGRVPFQLAGRYTDFWSPANPESSEAP
jgi:GTPase